MPSALSSKWHIIRISAISEGCDETCGIKVATCDSEDDAYNLRNTDERYNGCHGLMYCVYSETEWQKRKRTFRNRILAEMPDGFVQYI